MLNMKNHQIYKNDEIDLKELFLVFWNGKLYVILFSCLSIFLGSLHLKDVQREYLVEYKLKLVGEAQQKNNFSGLSGIASIAGINLPSSSTSDFRIFKELMSSVEVSKIIIKNKKLIQDIYAGEWNQSLKIFSEPPKSKSTVYKGRLKRILTGNKELNYMPPNARRLAMYISENIQIAEDKDTNFLTIRAETSKPDMFLSLISEVIKTSDDIMRQRYINFSTEPLAFYKEKLRTSRSREHREALAGLIGKEEQKLMLASRSKNFTVETYIDPTISFHPTTPNPKKTLLLSLILGMFIGCGIVFLRYVIMRNKI
jgi:hypothetical protein